MSTSARISTGSFLGNGAINRVNLHAAIQALTQGMGGVFVFVYLLKAGVAAPLVLMAVAAMTAGRFCLRPAVLVVARWRGPRATLIPGTASASPSTAGPWRRRG